MSITLGKTGLTIEKNGFGCLPIQRVSRQEAVRLLRRLWLHLRWEAGPAVVNHFSDRLRESQRRALKRRQKRIEESWVREDEVEDDKK